MTGEWLAKIVVGGLSGVIAKIFRQPKILEAFEKACKKCEATYHHSFSIESVKALSNSEGSARNNEFLPSVNKAFSDCNFPNRDELSNIFLDSWRRKVSFR